MTADEFLLRHVKTVRAAGSGWHRYLRGTCSHPEHEDTDAFAVFESKEGESRFQQAWSGQNELVTSSRRDFVRGAGLSLHDIRYVERLRG